jgi:hypothetical protein
VHNQWRPNRLSRRYQNEIAEFQYLVDCAVDAAIEIGVPTEPRVPMATTVDAIVETMCQYVWDNI